MRALDQKLLRDLWHLRGQVAAIGVVVACGVATVVTTRSTYLSLLASRDGYYAAYRFADVFVQLKRAPEALRPRLAAIAGVAAVQTRVVATVVLDVPGLGAPATGRLVSIATPHTASLNDLHLRAGRWPEPERRGEVLVSESFALANTLAPGDSLGAILNGRWERLRIVGVALSPEYVYEISGSEIFPDPKRFGVLWMSRAALGPAFDMDGAFNDVSLSLAPGASADDVIARVDRLLERYGGLGAYGRRDQISHRFLTDEIGQNRVTGLVLPAIFLAIAAFLLNVVLARLVGTQRDQIAVLKAFGYGNGAVGGHYLKLALVALAAGAVVGVGLGLWWAHAESAIYADYYRFPVWSIAVDPGAIVLGVLVTSAAALIGAAAAVRRAVRLPPAEAMRPEPPGRFRPGVLRRLGLERLLAPPGRMIVRNLERRPVKAAVSIVGIALSVAILVLGRYLFDAIRYMADLQFRHVQRENLTVVFNQPRPATATHAISQLAGVWRAEPFRVVPVRLRSAFRTRRVAIVGLDPAGDLRPLMQADRSTIPLPADGLVLSTKLAEILGVAPGDTVTVEVLEGSRPTRSVPVAARVDELIGLGAYMNARALHRLLREGGTVSGAFLAVDPRRADAVDTRLKQLPAVAGVASRDAALESFERTLAQSMGYFITVILGFAVAIAVAMVYNAARIALSERGRELASLRVLGFTRGEVALLLFGEQALLIAGAIPCGWVLGYGAAWILSSIYQQELFRIPLVVSGQTYLFAAIVVAVTGVLSGLLVRRRLDRFDLVAVLKTRE